MLKVARKGYVMGSVPDDVRRKSGYATFDNDTNCIAEVLKTYCFND